LLIFNIFVGVAVVVVVGLMKVMVMIEDKQ